MKAPLEVAYGYERQHTNDSQKLQIDTQTSGDAEQFEENVERNKEVEDATEASKEKCK